MSNKRDEIILSIERYRKFLEDEQDPHLIEGITALIAYLERQLVATPE